MLTDNIRQRIVDFVETLSPEFFVVDVRLKQGKKSLLVVRADTDKGISMGQCVEISRALNSWLEKEAIFDSEVELEVSSPGVGEPLLLTRQYRKNLNRDLRVQLLEGGQAEGRLMEVKDDSIVIFPYKKGKKLKKGQKAPLADEGKEILFEQIKESKVVINL